MNYYQLTDDDFAEIEKEACSCDLMAGYNCGIHRVLREIKEKHRAHEAMINFTAGSRSIKDELIDDLFSSKWVQK